jgi:hypothetical protein
MSKVFRRRIDGRNVEDSHSIDNIEYNEFSGAQKNVEVGPALKYVSATLAATGICPGDQLFLFKATTGLGYVTLGESAGISLGTTPAADTFPVFGQVYTPISAADYHYIIGTADIHLYVLRDDTQERVNP